jgi:hypothetical protein
MNKNRFIFTLCADFQSPFYVEDCIEQPVARFVMQKPHQYKDSKRADINYIKKQLVTETTRYQLFY